SSNSSVAGTGQPFLPAFCAALVGRAREASITRYGPSVAHVSRQHLLHQHIRGLDANPDHARQQAQHCVSSIIRPLLEACGAPSAPRSFIGLVRISPRTSWTRGSLSTPDCRHGPSSAPEHAS